MIDGLKTFANHHLAELVLLLLGAKTAILTLQNGLGNEDLLTKAFGAKRVLGGVAFLCSNRGEPGVILLLGEFCGGLSVRSKQLATMFEEVVVPCEAVADLPRAH